MLASSLAKMAGLVYKDGVWEFSASEGCKQEQSELDSGKSSLINSAMKKRKDRSHVGKLSWGNVEQHFFLPTIGVSVVPAKGQYPLSLGAEVPELLTVQSIDDYSAQRQDELIERSRVKGIPLPASPNPARPSSPASASAAAMPIPIPTSTTPLTPNRSGGPSTRSKTPKTPIGSPATSLASATVSTPLVAGTPVVVNGGCAAQSIDEGAGAIATLETRQYDYKHGIHNPLYAALNEEERRLVLAELDSSSFSSSSSLSSSSASRFLSSSSSPPREGLKAKAGHQALSVTPPRSSSSSAKGSGNSRSHGSGNSNSNSSSYSSSNSNSNSYSSSPMRDSNGGSFGGRSPMRDSGSGLSLAAQCHAADESLSPHAVAELHKEIRAIQRSRADNVGCQCKPVKVDKLSVVKMRSELLSLSRAAAAAAAAAGSVSSSGSTPAPPAPVLSREAIEALPKNELIARLKALLRDAPLCSGSDCECVVQGVACSAEACSCLRKAHAAESAAAANAAAAQAAAAAAAAAATTAAAAAAAAAGSSLASSEGNANAGSLENRLSVGDEGGGGGGGGGGGSGGVYDDSRPRGQACGNPEGREVFDAEVVAAYRKRVLEEVSSALG